MLNQYHASFQPSEDSGQYRCTARNERGEVSLAMSLEVNTDIAVGELNWVFLELQDARMEKWTSKARFIRWDLK